MKTSNTQINESSLRDSICTLKDRHEYRPLAEYLIGVLASGQVPAKLHVKAYNELGLAHLQLDEAPEAEKAFVAAMECDPKAVNPRFNQANLALYAQKYTHAFGLFRNVLDIDPDHVGACFHAGLCLAMDDRPVEAFPYFEASAKSAPEAMGPNFWGGETLLAQERFEEARPYFIRALQITPDHSESRRGLAICLFEMGQYEQCIEHCDILIESNKGDEYLALRIKGDALVEVGEVEEAALCHLQLAELDFDARNYLVVRGRKLSENAPEAGRIYQAIVADYLELADRRFRGTDSVVTVAANNHTQRNISLEEG